MSLDFLTLPLEHFFKLISRLAYGVSGAAEIPPEMLDFEPYVLDTFLKDIAIQKEKLLKDDDFFKDIDLLPYDDIEKSFQRKRAKLEDKKRKIEAERKKPVKKKGRICFEVKSMRMAEFEKKFSHYEELRKMPIHKKRQEEEQRIDANTFSIMECIAKEIWNE